jgi:hypothetical protein
VLSDRRGAPLSVVLSAANRTDMKVAAMTLDAVVVPRPEPTPARPQHLCRDKGFDYPETDRAAAARGYTVHTARRRPRGQPAPPPPPPPPPPPAGRRPPARRWVVERDALGCRWPAAVGLADPRRDFSRSFHGLGHGTAGTGYFLLRLVEATGEAQWRDLAREAADALAAHARARTGAGSNWPRFADEEALSRCQWCHGALGVGLFYAKAYEVIGDPAYLRTAEAAGECTFACGDVRRNPSQRHGLAGNVELFVELHRLTGAPRWRERAHDFARRALAYRTAGPEGDAWQGDEPGVASPAFMDGAAGTGHFFLRLLDPAGVAMPLL